MKFILAQPSKQLFDQNRLPQRKTFALIKAFKTQNQIKQLNLKQKLQNSITNSDIQAEDQTLKSNNPFSCGKITQKRPIKIKTQIIEATARNKCNIFNNAYVNCLKNGFTHAFQQKSKISNKKIDINDFEGPIFYSQRQVESTLNPELILQNYSEQIYKIDRNPRFFKFKVTLKRNSLNFSDIRKVQLKGLKKKKTLSRVLLTQLKTEQSRTTLSKEDSLKRIQSSQIKLDPINQPLKSKLKKTSQGPLLRPNLTIKNSLEIISKEKRSQKVCRKRVGQNLMKSIKLFERKRSLLGQIESQKGLQQKYGDRMFEYYLRNRYQSTPNRNDFIINVKYKKDSNQPQTENAIKNKFIDGIQQGEYTTNFKYKDRGVPAKLVGRIVRLQNQTSGHQKADQKNNRNQIDCQSFANK